MAKIDIPFPWMGGKAAIADVVWDRLGDVTNYVEPFFGGGGAFFNRPHWPFDPAKPLRTETVNDLDGFVANFWRSVQTNPEVVAEAADWPVNELDLHARGDWLFCRSEAKTFVEQLRADPDYYDPKTAGWWVWFVANWIGGLPGVEGTDHQNSRGVHRRRPHLGDTGKGVSRKRPHLGNTGKGVSRKRPHLGNVGKGECARRRQVLVEWMQLLADRLRGTRVCCGDWSRVCGPSVLFPSNAGGYTGVFFDPPYAVATGRDQYLYAVDSATVTNDVRSWCRSWGSDRRLRIILAGYEGEHEILENSGWQVIRWSAWGGYSCLRKGEPSLNRHRERLWCSPHCLHDGPLFAGMDHET